MSAHRVYVDPPDIGRWAIQGTYRPDGWGSQWFGRALPRARAGGVATVGWWGDSITVGDDASSLFGSGGAAGNSTAQKDAWRALAAPGIFRTGLQDRYGDAGEGYQCWGLAVTTGSWTVRPGFGVGAARATAAASATWKVRGTTIKLFARQMGAYRYQIDGGAFVDVVPPIGFGVDPAVSTVSGLSDGEHTIRVEWVSGTVELSGVLGLRPGEAGVRVDRCALHGVTASEMSTAPVARRRMSVTTATGSPNLTAGTGGYFTAADVGARIAGSGLPIVAYVGSVTSATTATLADKAGAPLNATASATVPALIDAQASNVGSPIGGLTIDPGFSEGLGRHDLVILAFGVNEAAWGTPLRSDLIVDSLSKIADEYMPTGEGDFESADFVMVIHHVGKWFDIESRYPMVAMALRDAADGLGAAVIDMYAAGRRSWSYAKEQRYWSGAAADNSIHPSQLGHGWLGEAMLALAAA